MSLQRKDGLTAKEKLDQLAQQANRERAEVTRAEIPQTTAREAPLRDPPDYKRDENSRPKVRTYDFEPDF